MGRQGRRRRLRSRLVAVTEDRPYHRYVFDVQQRRFVGAFEEMYRGEDNALYDSWHQEDLSRLDKRLSRTVLEGWNWASVLDVGCGKGAFTNALKRANNRVLGLDVSETAVAKARARFPGVEFRVGSVETLAQLEERFELVVAMEVLSYVEDWREALELFSGLAPALYLTLYLPPDPIGFVKSFDELRAEVVRRYRVETELVFSSPALKGGQLLLLARR